MERLPFVKKATSIRLGMPKMDSLGQVISLQMKKMDTFTTTDRNFYAALMLRLFAQPLQKLLSECDVVVDLLRSPSGNIYMIRIENSFFQLHEIVLPECKKHKA